MAELRTTHTFEGSLEKVFQGIRQYEKYPQYIPMVSSIEVKPPLVAGSISSVIYKVQLIKTFFYTLNMYEESPHKIWWSLADSNLMKKSNGSWELKEISPGVTTASYSLDIAFKGLVPQMIIDKVTASSLDQMMAGFQKLINDHSNK